MTSLRLKPFALLLILLAPATLVAELSFPHFFSNNMVLQRDREVAIWGKADPGANLCNSEDLPASIFRTDNWDDVE